MKILKFLFFRFFLRKPVPVRVMLVPDCMSALCEVALAIYLLEGALWLVKHQVDLVLGTLIALVPFIICFRLLHTYLGVIRVGLCLHAGPYASERT